MTTKSRTQRAIDYIFAHPGCRSDALAAHLETESKQVHSACAPAIAAGLIVACKVTRPGKAPVTEFKPSAAAPDKAPDFLEWKSTTPPEKVKPLHFSNPGPRASAAKPASSPASERVLTQADRGANNGGSSASDIPVGEAITSTEGAAVAETRAGDHAPEATSSAEPVVSDEISLGLNIQLNHHGNLTLGELTFSREETRAIGQFLMITEPVWS